MTKAELIERIARSRDLPPELSKKLIGQILTLAFDELAVYFSRTRVTRSSSPRFTFPRFGTFTKKRRSARRGVNPRTLEPITIEACDTVDFKASRELREAMNPGRSTDGEGEPARKPAASPRPAGKKTTKKSATRKTKTATSTRATPPRSIGRRRLAPREEHEVDVELGTLLTDDRFEAEVSTTPAVDVELPSSPMQRVKGRRRGRSRDTA